MGKTIKTIPLRDWGVIKHIQKKNSVFIKVELTNYDERFNTPSSETLLNIERKQQLNQIFRAFNQN